MTEDISVSEGNQLLEKNGSIESPPKKGLQDYFRDYLGLFIIAGGIIALDQWSKNLVRTSLAFGETWMPLEWLAPYARFVHWRNSGAAFGMFQHMGEVFTILAFVVAGIIIYYYPRVPRKDWAMRLAMGLQLGGAVGNLLDRLIHDGYVTDFISVGTFPVLNLADASISTGVAVLILGVWISERRAKIALEEASVNGEDGYSQGVQERLE